MTENALYRDYVIMLCLMENPMGTEKELSARVQKFISKRNSISTVHRYLHRAIKYYDPELDGIEVNGKKLMEAHSEKALIRGVSPQLNYPLLDLELYTIIAVPGRHNYKDNVKILSQFCVDHPYTVFCNTIYGAINGFYMQFAIPRKGNTIDFLLKSMDELQNKDVIHHYMHYKNIFSFNAYHTNLNNYDNEKWVIDSKAIEEALWKDHDMEHPEIPEYKLIKMDILDCIILREYSKNSRMYQTTMIQHISNNPLYAHHMPKIEYKLYKQLISRRIKNMNNAGLFKTYQLLYDRAHFGMFNQSLYLIPYSKTALNAVRYCFEEKLIPFPGSISYSKEYVFIWINLPPIELIDITALLTARFPQMKSFFFGRGETQKRFYFYHDNFDPKTRYWKNTPEYFDIPIKTGNRKANTKIEESPPNVEYISS